MLHFVPRGYESSPRRFAFRSAQKMRHGLDSFDWIGDLSSSLYSFEVEGSNLGKEKKGRAKMEWPLPKLKLKLLLWLKLHICDY